MDWFLVSIIASPIFAFLIGLCLGLRIGRKLRKEAAMQGWWLHGYGWMLAAYMVARGYDGERLPWYLHLASIALLTAAYVMSVVYVEING